MECNHCYVQMDNYWNKCFYCGFISPTGHTGALYSNTTTDPIIMQDNKQLTPEDVVFTIVEQWGNALFQGVEGGKKLVNKYIDQQTQGLQNQIKSLGVNTKTKYEELKVITDELADSAEDFLSDSNDKEYYNKLKNAIDNYNKLKEE